MEELIQKLMLQEHDRLNYMLKEFEKQYKNNSPITQETFIKFKLNLEKHFDFEEEFIFSIYTKTTNNKDFNIYKIIINLISEHKDIKSLVRKIENSFSKDIKSEISEIKKIITHHIKVENETLYPELDKKLTKEQKIEISHNAKEIIL